ncbi:MAG TPA: DUF5666 domain-containing protein [Xanthomonadaceae bacterium]|nr:DUF5666 domain-containing protein [Xanthomonadaceae bacterium]
MRAILSTLRRGRGLFIAAVASLALAGCASYGLPGGYGGGYGYPGGGYGQQYGNQVVGTVQGLDRARIIISTESGGYGYGGQQLALYYDRNTRLHYQGRVYPVEGLERGDVIRAEVIQSGGRLYTRQIEVVRNIRESGGYYPGGGYGDYGDYEQLRGRVSWVDDRAQVIRLDAGGYGGQMVEVRFDSRTYVEWRGDRYPARDLDPGDVVSIQARRSGNSWFAERIVLESNAGR